MHNVVILGPLLTPQVPFLRERLGATHNVLAIDDGEKDAQARSAFANADVIVAITYGSQLPPAPRLKLLQVGGAGYEMIDFEAVPPSAAICNAFGHEEACAEYAVLGMLAWCHRFVEATQSFRQGSWEFSGRANGAPHDELQGKTVGIIGLGRIGRAIASRLAPFGVRTIAVNRSPLQSCSNVSWVGGWNDLDRLLEQSDFVVVACALTPETTDLISEERLQQMRSNAVLINVARGPIVNEGALFAALQTARIGGAVLDAWYRYPDSPADKPRPSQFPFETLPNVYMTPHYSGWTRGMFARRWGSIAENIQRAHRGEQLLNLVRPPKA